MISWQNDVDRLHGLLSSVSFRDREGQDLKADEGFARWCDLTARLRAAQRTIYLIGNGASASMASHFSADLAKNGHLHTQVFSDLSLITAISNDISYDQVFALPLQRRGQAGDMLVAISSSGRSRNILAAAEIARSMKITLVTLSGMKPDNPLRQAGDLNIYIAADTYGLAETGHSAILHRWMDLVEVKS